MAGMQARRRPTYSRPHTRKRYGQNDTDYQLEAFKHLRNLVISIGIYGLLVVILALPGKVGDGLHTFLMDSFTGDGGWAVIQQQTEKIAGWSPSWTLPVWGRGSSNQSVISNFAVPVAGRVTSPFGPRANPVTQAAEEHQGVDIEAKVGTPVVAAYDGVVISSGTEDGYGNCVRIEHENGIVTVYAHLLRLAVGPQDLITKGQTIGWVGNSGTSIGYHLHFEIWENENPIDPAKYLTLAP